MKQNVTTVIPNVLKCETFELRWKTSQGLLKIFFKLQTVSVSFSIMLECNRAKKKIKIKYTN